MGGTQIPEKTAAELAAEQAKIAQMAEDSKLAQQLGNSYAADLANQQAFAGWDTSDSVSAEGEWLRNGACVMLNNSSESPPVQEPGVRLRQRQANSCRRPEVCR